MFQHSGGFVEGRGAACVAAGGQKHFSNREHVGDMSRETPDMVEPPTHREDAVARHRAERRLPADDSAISGRSTDAAAGLRAERGGAHAGRHGRRRSTAAAPRRAGGVPRIAGFGRVEAGELGSDRFAEHDRPRLTQGGDDRRVAFGPMVVAQRRAAAGADAGDVDHVLDSDRNAEERTDRPVRRMQGDVAGSRLGQGRVGVELRPTGEARLAGFNRVQQRGGCAEAALALLANGEHGFPK